MKNKVKFWKQILQPKMLLGVVAAGLMVSCGSYMGAYSETDGAYYDPDMDRIPEYYGYSGQNRVGSYYDFGDDDQISYDDGIINKGLENRQQADSRYDTWGDGGVSDSDWGTYTGTETVYTNWGSMWGSSFYSPFYYGWGYPYYYGGWGYPYYGFGPSWGWGMSIGFGFGWGGYYGSPYFGSYWGGYYPSYYYRPYYGYGGYYGGYYGSVLPRSYNRGADLINRGRSANSFQSTTNNRTASRYTGNQAYQRQNNIERQATQNGFRRSGVGVTRGSVDNQGIRRTDRNIQNNGYVRGRNTQTPNSNQGWNRQSTTPRSNGNVQRTRTPNYNQGNQNRGYSSPRSESRGFSSPRSGGNFGGSRGGGGFSAPRSSGGGFGGGAVRSGGGGFSRGHR